jgi:transposase
VAPVAGKVVVARKLRRKQVLAFFAKLPPCLVGMEASASAHFWAREITKLGRTVKLMAPKYVKAYAKRGKTDAIDAAAIREAIMSFVPMKGEQQSLSMLHSAPSQPIGRLRSRRLTITVTQSNSSQQNHQLCYIP